MALMRRLLVDAQAKFRRMVEENKQLAARIDGDIQSAQEEVAVLREDLSDATRQLDEHLKNTNSSKEQDACCSPPNLNPTSTAAIGTVASDSAISSTTATSSSSARASDSCIGSSTSSPHHSRVSSGVADCGPTKSSGGYSDTESARGFEEEVQKPPGDGGGKKGNKDKENDTSPVPSTSSQAIEGNSSGGIIYKSLTSTAHRSRSSCDNPAAAMRLRLENERLQCEVTELRKLVSSRSDGASALVDLDDQLKIRTLELELQAAKEAMSAMKLDRKRLKAEKFDLLNQMKQLYATLEDKEKELRDFIRNYEQMRESETSMQQLSTEREERERERWSLLRHARDEAERSLSLAAQLDQKDQQLQQLQEQLQDARRQLSSGGCLSDQESIASLSMSVSRVNGSSGGFTTPTASGLLSSHHGFHSVGLLPGDRGSCSADSGVRVSSDRESGGATSGGGNLSDSTTEGTPTITLGGTNVVDMDTVSIVSSNTASHIYQSATSKDCSPSLSPMNANTFSRSIDSSILSRSVEQLSNPMEIEPRRNKNHHNRSSAITGSRGTWGSISRVFARSRHRKVASPSSQDDSADPYRSWSPLTEEGYAEKLRLLREAASIPMERWRAPTVLAWLEIALGMPQYGPRCAENVKSGKVLLELSDVELDVGLGITHPMHRKKLRLAIEEHRHPALVRYPCIAQLGHTWVSSEWLPDLGLAQYSENFATNMVDARMLDHLSKKELEKFLGVTRKFHQASVVHGIHLLRMMKYDRQALAVRRHQCDTIDADPLVWTNQRFIRWARNIDLSEYAENLKDSGVHGALVVLEASFNGDTMATALGIPPSKNIIRRHLSTELEALVLPARTAFEHFMRISKAERRRAEKLVGGGSLGRSFSHSYTGGLVSPNNVASSQEQEKERRRSSLRGSLSRTFGLRMRQDSSASSINKCQSFKQESRENTSCSLASPSSSSENSSSFKSIHSKSFSTPKSTHNVNDEVETKQNHRKVKSISDMETIIVTPV